MNKQMEKKEKIFLTNRMPTTNAEGKMDSENHSDNHDSNWFRKDLPMDANRTEI